MNSTSKNLFVLISLIVIGWVIEVISPLSASYVDDFLPVFVPSLVVGCIMALIYSSISRFLVGKSKTADIVFMTALILIGSIIISATRIFQSF